MKGRKLNLVDDTWAEDAKSALVADGSIEPEPEAPCPEPPDSLTFEAKLEWQRVAPILHRQGRLVDSIMALFENFCICQGRVAQYEQYLVVDGLIVGGKAHPAIKLQQEAMKEARMLAAELQLTRAGAKKQIEEVKEAKDDWPSNLLA